jgi:hypothetical protein
MSRCRGTAFSTPVICDCFILNVIGQQAFIGKIYIRWSTIAMNCSTKNFPVLLFCLLFIELCQYSHISLQIIFYQIFPMNNLKKYDTFCLYCSCSVHGILMYRRTARQQVAKHMPMTTNSSVAMQHNNRGRQVFSVGLHRDCLLGNCMVTRLYNNKVAVFSVLHGPCQGNIRESNSEASSSRSTEKYKEL